MTNNMMDTVFSNALRSELEERANAKSLSVRRLSKRAWTVLAATVGSGLVLGGSAAIADYQPLPGEAIVTELGDPVRASGSGNHVFELGPAPEGTTGVWVKFGCVTKGTFTLIELGIPSPAVSTSFCEHEHASQEPGASGYYPLDPSNETGFSLEISTDPQSSWVVEATYINAVDTPWGVLESGETYGVLHLDGSTPDLELALASNGKSGYVRWSEEAKYHELSLEPGYTISPETQATSPDATFEIPVYEDDGVTQIGWFPMTRL